jgi:ectoine hydroxylase-related dioxygenase (phytanoyl-CoA dioxygenase family)
MVLAGKLSMLPEYWRWPLGRKEAVIDGSFVPEDILGELSRTSFLDSSGHALRFKLERDGYIYFPELIDIKEIKEARNEIFKRLYEVDELEAPYLDGRFSHRSRRDELHNDRGAFWETVSNGKLLRNVSNGPVLEKVTSQIFGTPAVGFDYLFLRAVPQGRSTHLHCDSGFFTRVTKEVLTCWVAFTEIPLDNGPLFIVEGSHKFIDIHDNFKDFDVALNKEKKASIDEHPVSFARQRNAKLLTTTFTPGDVLIFGMDTLHGAFENYAANNRIRLTCDIRYQPRDKPKDHRYFGVNPSGTTGAGYGELNGARPLVEDWHIR